MNVTQVYQFVNAATKETLGETAVVNEDLSNIVDVGGAISAANGLDNYVRALTNHIGKVVFDNRRLDTAVPSIVRDAWEWGSILEKVHMALPEATENETWSLVDGQTYNQDKFYQPKVYTKFFNKRVTFEVDLSITETQVKESFSNAAQAAAFVAMLYNGIDQSMVIKLDDLILRTINNFIGETIHDDNGANLRAVNLLSLYTTMSGQSLTVAKALYDSDFLRFAAKIIKQYIRRMRRPSTLFNIGGTKKFTPADRMNVVMLGEFASAAEIYLYNGSGQFLVNNIQLPNADTVEYWQGTGTDYGFTSASAIDIVTTERNTVQQSGILCCVFDRDALGVANLDRRTRTHTNDKGEFVNNFVKADAGYWNDFNENFVVFYIAT